jgi:hypothetical protein
MGTTDSKLRLENSQYLVKKYVKDKMVKVKNSEEAELYIGV